MIIDLHVHSRHTPGCAIDPSEAVRRAHAAGLDGICFTDLDTLAGLEEFRALAKEAPIKVFVALELAAERGHYLVFFPQPEKVPELGQLLGPKPWVVKDVLAKLNQLGAAVVAAHPFEKDMESPVGDLLYTLRGLAGIEVHNPRVKAGANELAVEAAEHLRVPCVSGSASKPHLEDMGRAGTLFKRPVASEADIVEQLKQGAVWAVTLGGQPQPESRPSRGGPGERRRDRDVDRRTGREGRGGGRGGGRGRGGSGRGGGRGGRDRDRGPGERRPPRASTEGRDLEEPPRRSDGPSGHVQLTVPQGEPPRPPLPPDDDDEI